MREPNSVRCVCTDEQADRCEWNRLAGKPWPKDPPKDLAAIIVATLIAVAGVVLIVIGSR